jgi:hypothetical protein
MIILGAIAGKVSDWVPHTLHWLLLCIPAVTAESGRLKINTAMIIQALIIAGVGGAIVGYMNLGKMEVRFDAMMDEIVEIKQDVKDIRKDFYKPRIP